MLILRTCVFLDSGDTHGRKWESYVHSFCFTYANYNAGLTTSIVRLTLLLRQGFRTEFVFSTFVNSFNLQLRLLQEPVPIPRVGY